MSRQLIQIAIGTLLIVLAAVLRIIPHEWNFSPVGAMFLFSIATFQRKWLALLIPFATLWISDLYLMNTVYAEAGQSWKWAYGQMEWMYATYLVIAVAGYFILSKISVIRVIGASLTASVLFFIITNFMCWPGSPLYSQDISGLIACYTAGIPFFRGTVMGDLIFSTILFGSHYLIVQRWMFPIKQAKTV
jgi:hypothetical protein